MTPPENTAPEMTKPRIAIPVPTSTDFEYNRQSWSQYAEAVRRSGGEPVEVRLDAIPAETARLITSCQGLVLPGSPADVNPQKYGREPEAACAAADPARENVDELLLQDAHNLYKPILAICFGAQMLNVWRGGTLVQDLMPLAVNHSAGKAVAVAHTVDVVPDSLLAGFATAGNGSTVDESPRLSVNSSHHQAIELAGDGLTVSGRSSQDGVVEAVEGETPGHFVLGVQWHPERSFYDSPTSAAMFERLVTEAAAWVPRPVHTSVGS
jgi:putative glutamine amidotransferase